MNSGTTAGSIVMLRDIAGGLTWRRVILGTQTVSTA